MNSNLLRTALIMAATEAYAQDNVFGYSSHILDAPKCYRHSDRQKLQPKVLH